MRQISVALVDDHALFRMGLAELLERDDSIRVAGIAGTPDEARALMETRPDVVLMDLHMPQLDGITLLTRLRQDGIDIPTIMLTVSEAQEDMAQALRAGARGYLLKDAKLDELIDAIRRVAEGETVVARIMTAKLVNLLTPPQLPQQGSPLNQLTSRER